MFAIQLAIYIILTVTGLTLVKLGSATPTVISLADNAFQLRVGYVSLAGLVCYVCSFLLYMYLVTKHNLSFLVPLATGLTYVTTMLISSIVFKEKITSTHVLASVLILVGVVLINYKKA